MRTTTNNWKRFKSLINFTGKTKKKKKKYTLLGKNQMDDTKVSQEIRKKNK